MKRVTFIRFYVMKNNSLSKMEAELQNKNESLSDILESDLEEQASLFMIQATRHLRRGEEMDAEVCVSLALGNYIYLESLEGISRCKKSLRSMGYFQAEVEEMAQRGYKAAVEFVKFFQKGTKTAREYRELMTPVGLKGFED